MSKVKTPAKFRHSSEAWEECGPCPVFAYHTLAFASQPKKKSTEKTSARVVERQLDKIQYVDMATFR
jgi:hypothetical protein